MKKVPLVMAGLMLGTAATGNLLMSYGMGWRYLFGIIAAIILLLLIYRWLSDTQGALKELNHPIVGSVFPAASMAWMLLSTYLIPFMPELARILWWIGFTLHIIAIIIFTFTIAKKRDIKTVFPSWVIVYIGIGMAAISGPAHAITQIPLWSYWFAFIFLVILIPLILYRVHIIAEVPTPAIPNIGITAAPASLVLVGYLNAFPEKNITFLIGQLIVAQLLYLYVLVQLPRLMNGFSPAYSGFTFATAISAIGLKTTTAFLLQNTDLNVSWLQPLVLIETIICVIMVTYVLFGYIRFLLTKPEQAL